jgi:hypothetical protein
MYLMSGESRKNFDVGYRLLRMEAPCHVNNKLYLTLVKLKVPVIQSREIQGILKFQYLIENKIGPMSGILRQS